MSIVKRLGARQDDLHDLSASLNLPSVLYRPLLKEEENDSLVCIIKLPLIFTLIFILDAMKPHNWKNCLVPLDLFTTSDICRQKQVMFSRKDIIMCSLLFAVARWPFFVDYITSCIVSHLALGLTML